MQGIHKTRSRNFFLTRLTLVLVFFIISLIPAAYGQSGRLEMRKFPVRSFDPESLIAVVQKLNSSDGEVVYDKRTHSLIVLDTPQNLERIAEVIGQLQEDTKQVQIEVTVAEVSEAFLQDAGIRSTQVIIPRGQFVSVLSLIQDRGDAHIRSRSTVRTVSNHPASIQVTRDTLIPAEVVRYSDGTTVVVPERKPVGSILEVLPRVNDDSTITLSVQPSFSTLDDSSSVPLDRSLSTQVLVNDGDTVLIGGLDAVRQEQRQEKVSFLGIPIFSSKAEGARHTVIFLTAEIVR